MVKGLVYLSDANVDFDINDLTALTKQAREKNQQLGVTGYLCYARKRFMQYIEAEPDVLESLINTIIKDSRHTVLYLLHEEIPRERRFPSWGMRYITPEELQRFNIELCIEQNMLYLKNDFAFKEHSATMIWKEIDTIANMQSRMYA